jgi:hypothetical protein
MAQNSGGNGKGASKFRTDKEDADDRHAAKARRGKGRGGNYLGRETLRDGILADRLNQRVELTKDALADALKHLGDFAGRNIPRKRWDPEESEHVTTWSPRWSKSTTEMAKDLLKAYFDPELNLGNLEPLEKPLNDRVLLAVRRQFGITCANRRWQKRVYLPAEDLTWFDEAVEFGTKYLQDIRDRNRQRRAAENEAALRQAEGQTDETTATDQVADAEPADVTTAEAPSELVGATA